MPEDYFLLDLIFPSSATWFDWVCETEVLIGNRGARHPLVIRGPLTSDVHELYCMGACNVSFFDLPRVYRIDITDWTRAEMPPDDWRNERLSQNHHNGGWTLQSLPSMFTISCRMRSTPQNDSSSMLSQGCQQDMCGVASVSPKFSLHNGTWRLTRTSQGHANSQCA